MVGASYDDFWPGQYDKTWTYARSGGYKGLAAAIKSGDSFIVNGDLIDALDFHATLGKTTRTMGQTLSMKKGQKAVVTIAYRSPVTNNNGDRVRLSHIDLIAGRVTGAVADSNPSAHVVATYGRSQFHLVNGWRVVTVVFAPRYSTYFRLRGTNLAAGTPNQTDSAGNPLIDTLAYRTLPNPDPSKAATRPTVTVSTPAQAWADLWFYSNPIFIKVT